MTPRVPSPTDHAMIATSPITYNSMTEDAAAMASKQLAGRRTRRPNVAVRTSIRKYRRRHFVK
jgi:hypothetical protein